MKETLARQSFLGDKSDEFLDSLAVGIVGLGGAGSHIVQQLSHVGVGNLLLIDPQRIEPSNLNRLVGATLCDTKYGRFKSDIARRVSKSVNPSAHLTVRRTPWKDSIIDLRDVDIIVGCLDSYSERSQLEGFARRYLIPYLDIGMDVHNLGDHYVVSGQVAFSIPGDDCLRCMGIITENDVAKEKYGAAGGNPQVVWANGVLASAAVGLLMEMVTPWFKSDRRSEFLSYDGNGQFLTRHNWMKRDVRLTCPHYQAHDVGDPHPIWIVGEKNFVQVPNGSVIKSFLCKLYHLLCR